MAEKIIKGLALGGIFAIGAYILSKDIMVALVSGMIMFMSMFVKRSE